MGPTGPWNVCARIHRQFRREAPSMETTCSSRGRWPVRDCPAAAGRTKCCRTAYVDQTRRLQPDLGPGPGQGRQLLRHHQFRPANAEGGEVLFQPMPAEHAGVGFAYHTVCHRDSSVAARPSGLLLGQDGNLATANFRWLRHPCPRGLLLPVPDRASRQLLGAGAFTLPRLRLPVCTGKRARQPAGGQADRQCASRGRQFLRHPRLGEEAFLNYTVSIFQLIPPSTPGGSHTHNTLYNYDFASGPDAENQPALSFQGRRQGP